MINRILYFFVFLFSLYVTLHSQDKISEISVGKAPVLVNPLPPTVIPGAGPLAWSSRAFGYNISGGSVAKGPVKFFLNAPGSLTSISEDPQNTNYLQAGCFDGNGTWWGIRYGMTALVMIDTSTGAITTWVNTIGTTNVTGLAWDFTTNTMYASDFSAGICKIGTLNLLSGVFTALPGTIGPGIILDIACSNSGQIYGHMTTSPSSSSQIYSINKTTGVGTLIGPTGFNAYYAQGMSWDHRVDSGYIAGYNYPSAMGELRKINISTGATTLIGSFGCQLDGFAIHGAPGPQIIHTPYPNTQNITGPYIQNAIITTPGSGIIPYWTKIFWSRNNPVITDSLQMTNTSGTNWTGNIPGNGTSATYRYYIRTKDSLGRVSVVPPGAPATLYTFTAFSTDTSKPVITHTPIGNTSKYKWPPTVNCSVTEPYGIDSVWVRWNKNSDAYKRFNLSHNSGNNWSGPFNADTSQIAEFDVIHYRIIARSSSAQHTLDSTALYSFTIINPVSLCIGTGTTASNYPFTTYWEDGRTDMLFLSSEIIAAGGHSGTFVGIGFDVVEADSVSINGFNIKLQTTGATSISAFTNTGWTICYNGTYSVKGAGRRYINFTTPFYWTSGQNILIEVCYNNSFYTNNSTINATPSAGLMVGYSADLPSGDGCIAAWTANSLPYRANVCLLNFPIGIGNINTGIPNKFNLSQNYPNPFNPNTKIDYSIPKKGFVSLKIFDILGREIKTLVNENKTVGNYSIDFNGTEFPSGVYFYKLTCNDFTDVKKMILIK